jgi:hypothetical protein
MRGLTYAEIDAARHRRGATALLFITDRCPVGCAHCSVDSRPDSPKIRDFARFERVVDGLCASAYQLIGITGGEPFVERRGLSHATARLRSAGKDVSIVTSGVWATTDDPPGWIRDVIRRCGSLILSTDTFHSAVLPEQRFLRAARTIAREGAWLVAQVIDDPRTDAAEQAARLLERALGADWAASAEIHRVPLLPYGRAESIFQPVTAQAVGGFGPCHLARSPVIRYDGTMSVCCNEAVIMGRGPAALRRECDAVDEVAAGFSHFDEHALLRAVGDVGPGVLTLDPRLQDLGDRRYRSICELCWEIVGRVGDAADDPVFRAASALTGGTSGAGG